MITLLQSSGNPATDQAIIAVIAAFEQAFPGRVSGYYALGSYADGSAVATSDIDLTIIFTGAFEGAAERDAAQRMAITCAEASPFELDIELDDEAALAQGASPQFMLGSALLYGADIRERVSLVSLVEWTRDRMH
ncbi:MAG: nucleotidyltransferase domain-containing protein, partial [Ktedonobacterales bacterium]